MSFREVSIIRPFSHNLFTINFILKWRVGHANTSVPVTFFPVVTFLIRLSICSYHSGHLYVCMTNLLPSSEIEVTSSLHVPLSASVVHSLLTLVLDGVER